MSKKHAFVDEPHTSPTKYRRHAPHPGGLVLTMHPGPSEEHAIVFLPGGDELHVRVIEVRDSKTVRVLFSAPRYVKILRSSVVERERSMAENPARGGTL